jgi:glycyl-tRNA synthetase
MEVTQFTYFQQVGGIDLHPVTGEITYGLERLCMFLQGCDNVFQLQYNEHYRYGDIFHLNEVQGSRYNFELADVALHRELFGKFEAECQRVCATGNPLPAADYCLKASHAFNLLDARGAISVNERQSYILRVRTLARTCAEAWLKCREEMGFPLLRGQAAITSEAAGDDPRLAGAVAAYAAAPLPERLPLLLELGVEEMPAQVFASLQQQLPQLFAKHFGNLELDPQDVACYVTPRRIVISVGSLAARQPDHELELKGPPIKVARDAQGQWTKAAQAWAAKNGLTVDELEVRTIGGADYIYKQVRRLGQPALAVLAPVIPRFFADIHWYKLMRWGTGSDQFVRPVQWLVALLGEHVVPCRFGGVASGDQSRGHRFMANRAVPVTADRAAYAQALRQAWVIVDHQERRETIRRLVQETAAGQGLTWRTDEALLTEVSHLVEYPFPVLCTFPPEILVVPELVLVSEMKQHQKQLALLDASGRLSNHFIGISNTNCPDMTLVRAGFQKVLGSRFADAKFFLAEDQKKPLAERVPALAGMVFQDKLGTILDKVGRVEQLSAWLAEQLGLDAARRTTVAHIAHLCKADLTTAMVGEFPELQGEIGRYYAQAEKLPALVADGIRDHYLPRGLADELPGSDEAAIVALADRLDSLVGIFGIGKAPTSSSDPFALRRACLSTIAITVNRGFRLDLQAALRQSLAIYGERLPAAARAKVVDELLAFYHERAKRLFNEPPRPGVPGDFAKDTIEAVLQARAPWQDFTDLVDRLQAMAAFRRRDDFAAVAATFKRASNILDRKVQGQLNVALLTQPAEQALLAALTQAEAALQARLAARDYVGALATVAPLREPVDAFFAAVMVNDPDAAIRAQRHLVLARVVALVLQVADFAQIQE